jgi:hypothetical protein
VLGFEGAEVGSEIQEEFEPPHFEVDCFN